MIYLVSCLKKLIMAWDARGLWDFFFLKPIATISVNGAQEGKKTASLLQNTSNTFPISAVQFFLLKLSTLQALKIVKKMMISGGSKSPLVVTSPQRLQLCLSEQQAIGELP